MFKKNTVIFWVLMITFTLSFMEIFSSIYYFQRWGNYEAPFAVVQLWHSVKKRIDQSGILEQPKLNSRYVNDDRFGWSIRKNKKTVDVCGDNKITYTIDSNKERFIPGPKILAGYIVFLGGSFTFGTCVNDRESYPYILATEHWKNWDIRNAAVGAWGTSQAYLMLSDLIESNTPPQ